VIKWVVGESETPQALALRQYNLSAPDLLVAECANILWKKVRRGELSANEAVFAARLLDRAEIELIPARGLMETATKLAVALDHPAYDCLYLALAERSGRSLVTADARLLRKMEATPTGLYSGQLVDLLAIPVSQP
jgi:predicted nucleic acid-binding protein